MAQRYANLDYSFRPSLYWASAEESLSELLRNVKGTNRRRMIRDYYQQGRIQDLDPALRTDTLDDERRAALGRIHPSFMGGEYLPKYRMGEVAIALIELQSTTADVVSIRARRGLGHAARIRYRIEDEYDTKFVWAPKSTQATLTLGELVDLIDGASPGDDFEWFGGLALCYTEMNFEGTGDAEDLRDFTTVSSEYYPQLRLHYDRVHDEWVASKTASEDAEDSDSE